MMNQTSPRINVSKQTIAFCLHDDFYSHVSFKGASHISLSGSFNHWAKDELLLEQDNNGTWKIEIPMLPSGTYHYKFIIDDKILTEDFDNPNRQPDGTTGFNSIFTIEN
jgi:hypothetical protein